MIRRRVVVHGFVQGVFFRDTLRRQAAALGVSGWARNTSEGTVEAVFEGEPDAVERIGRCNAGQAWCATTLPGGEFYVVVEDPSKTLSDAELLQISDGLTFADIKDSTTWYPAG